MGGSSNPFSNRTPSQLARLVEQAHGETDDSAFRAELAQTLSEYLSNYNNRDPETIKNKLDEVKSLIQGQIDESVDFRFGGSVSKHTYVDGLSDVDTLCVLKEEFVAGKPPGEVLHNFSQALSAKVGEGIQVTSGRLAITLKYPDGTELQVLPALRDGELVKVPSWDGGAWKAIRPKRFADALTQANNRLGGKLIPTIKLVKAINSQLAKPLQLSGYHIESIAIEAFKSAPDGAVTPQNLTREFFSRAKEIVKKPIVDRTGQSRHVDDHLGGANSTERVRLSGLMDRLEKRIVNANRAQSVDQWRALFGDE